VNDKTFPAELLTFLKTDINKVSFKSWFCSLFEMDLLLINYVLFTRI